MFNNLDSFMFGAALAAGDFDGNGVPDLAIGLDLSMLQEKTTVQARYT